MDESRCQAGAVSIVKIRSCRHRRHERRHRRSDNGCPDRIARGETARPDGRSPHIARGSARSVVACFLAAIASLALVAGAAQTQTAEEPVSLVFGPNPPNAYDGSEGPSGFLYDTVALAFERMGYAVEGEEIPWARVYAGIEAGMHDAAVGVVPTPARREEAYYSHPLVSEYSILIKRPDASIEVDSLQDLEGLIVGTQIGFAYPRLESLEGVTMEGVDTDIINGRKLSAGRIDLAVVGSLTGRYTLDQAGIDYEVVGAIEALPLSVALAHDRFTPAQVERLNSTLSDILISERFSAIIRRYGVHDLVQTFSILPDEAPPDQSSMLGP